MAHSIILLLVVVILVGLGALFSGSETGLYQLSRLRLRLGLERKRPLFVILGRCLHDSPGLLLSLLIGNNLVNSLATSLVTSMFLAYMGVAHEHKAELLATLVMVPTLFVFSEMIPKNVFFYRADVLMPYLSPLLYAFHKPLSWCGVIPLLKLVSSVFTRLAGLAASSKTVITSTQRHKIHAILQDTHEEGILSPVQSDIINRLVAISHVHIRSVMTPLPNVETARVDSDRAALLAKLGKCPYTRLPVIEAPSGNIIGYVNIYEALGSPDEFTDLQGFLEPIRRLDGETTVTDAMNIMQKERQKILLVAKGGHGRERPVGIVTMKDLVEELLGELAEW